MDVAGSIPPAIRWAIGMLVRPFRPWTWIGLGFIVTFDGLVQGDTGFNYSVHPRNFRPFVEWFYGLEIAPALVWALSESGLLLILGMPVVFFTYLVSIVIMWVGSHAQVIFIHSVVRSEVQPRQAWYATYDTGHSIFLVRFIIASFGFLLLLIVMMLNVLIALTRVSESPAETHGILHTYWPVLIVITAGGAGFFVFNLLLRNFIAPIMYHRKFPMREAIRDCWDIIRTNTGPIILFFAIRTILVGGFLILMAFGTCLTCGILLIPVLRHALLAPLYVFDRAFSLYCLQSLGPAYAMLPWYVGKEGEAL